MAAKLVLGPNLCVVKALPQSAKSQYLSKQLFLYVLYKLSKWCTQSRAAYESKYISISHFSFTSTEKELLIYVSTRQCAAKAKSLPLVKNDLGKFSSSIFS